MSEAVKEAECIRCVHRNVCAFKNDYLEVYNAIQNTTVTKEAKDGKVSLKRVTDYDFIRNISVNCCYCTENTVYRESPFAEPIAGLTKGDNSETGL